jgi:N-acetyl-gamma-glutamyl-phosphate reductase
MTFRIAIAGASGYAGGEMARLVSAHPSFELGTLTAHSNEGRSVRDVHPHLRSLGDAVFAPTRLETLIDHDVVVLALPHGQSAELGEQLITARADLTVVDLGADRRLIHGDDWEAFYGGPYAGPWTYGMPELVRADGSKQRSVLAGATRIAAPGCNASAITFALAPLAHKGLIDLATIVASLAVAPSGAGRTLRDDLLASERMSSAQAYAVGGRHRHIPEIIQSVSAAAGVSRGDLTLSMTPMLVPLSRGILAVTTASLKDGAGETEVKAAFHDAYGEEDFVHVLTDGAMPSTGSVLGSNSVAIGFDVNERSARVTVVTAIDNLVKGTAGAATQSVNIALGLPEAQGLAVDGVAP